MEKQNKTKAALLRLFLCKNISFHMKKIATLVYIKCLKTPENNWQNARYYKMTQWQIARYLIDAKKEVDSLWYIATNKHQINGDVRRLIELRRNTFYINTAAVVDKFIDARPTGINKKQYKENLQANNHLIKKLYMYRDKHAAHKDDDFQDTEFQCLMDIVRECIAILKEVKNVCASILPTNITLNFVCYDGNLFRLIYGIDKYFESKIGKLKYSCHKPTTNHNITKKYFKTLKTCGKQTTQANIV